MLELPSGAVEAGEAPMDAARRELFEETGCEARELAPLGQLHVDSGRLETQQWAFFAQDVRVVNDQPVSDEELEVRFVTPEELKDSILEGEFNLSLHLAMVGLAVLPAVCGCDSLGF